MTVYVEECDPALFHSSIPPFAWRNWRPPEQTTVPGPDIRTALPEYDPNNNNNLWECAACCLSVAYTSHCPLVFIRVTSPNVLRNVDSPQAYWPSSERLLIQSAHCAQVYFERNAGDGIDGSRVRRLVQLEYGAGKHALATSEFRGVELNWLCTRKLYQLFTKHVT
jgi:hypothetical protein